MLPESRQNRWSRFFRMRCSTVFYLPVSGSPAVPVDRLHRSQARSALRSGSCIRSIGVCMLSTFCGSCSEIMCARTRIHAQVQAPVQKTAGALGLLREFGRNRWRPFSEVFHFSSRPTGLFLSWLGNITPQDISRPSAGPSHSRAAADHDQL